MSEQKIIELERRCEGLTRQVNYLRDKMEEICELVNGHSIKVEGLDRRVSLLCRSSLILSAD